MGRGRKGLIMQGFKKQKKEYGPTIMTDRGVIGVGQKKIPADQTSVFYLPKEVLNELRQLNPRAVANILVNFR